MNSEKSALELKQNYSISNKITFGENCENSLNTQPKYTYLSDQLE